MSARSIYALMLTRVRLPKYIRELAREEAEVAAAGWHFLAKPSSRGEVVRANVMTCQRGTWPPKRKS